MISDGELYNLAIIAVQAIEMMDLNEAAHGLNLSQEVKERVRSETLYVAFKRHLEEKETWSKSKKETWEKVVSPLTEEANQHRIDFEKEFFGDKNT